MIPMRPVWRLLATTLVIVAFVMPSAVQAHYGHTHPATETGITALAGHADLDLADSAHSEPGDLPAKTSSHAACCAACAGHVSLTAPEPVASLTWQKACLTPPCADLGHPSVTPEALPKPPRSFA